MSNLLWKYYLEDDVERFRRLLANSQSHHGTRSNTGGVGSGNAGAVVGSPITGSGTSPRAVAKGRKSSGYGVGSATKAQAHGLGRSDLNSRDRSGLTILHRASSSTGANAVSFALALIEHSMVDIYIQDVESGWTALHRALYFGNVTVARALMDRDLKESTGQGANNTILQTNRLIKIKDHEGNSAFDVYNATIARRTLSHSGHPQIVDDSEADDDESLSPVNRENDVTTHNSVGGDEMFAFGSNKNLTLGFGDEDDRQHPERVTLKRPDHLLHRFYREQLLLKSDAGEIMTDQPPVTMSSLSTLPIMVRNRPIIFQDVVLSKLHSAILTADPESNLYLCGFGPGGRLGTGDETTKFNYVCIEGGGLAGKKIVAIALGQNHSIAVSSNGEVFTWGTNTWGQLGYSLPRPATQDDEPMNCTPRQIFGPLKREVIIGVAASAIHSVAFTTISLFTWGKNGGQLGLMDSDSRSLELQTVPRRVAASLFTSPIRMVSAINRATICLLTNHTVYVFTNYGYNNVKFPMNDGFTNYHLNHTPLATRYEAVPSHISSITSGGETIAAISSRGDLFTLNVSQKLDASLTAASTTNPSKIRNALSQPQRVWSLRKGHWDGIKSVGVGENGSVIICTQAGAVWHRIRRPKIKISHLSSNGDSKSKDYKFQRVPGLTKVAAVRSNVFGAYAALRRDCDITRTQIVVDTQLLWSEVAPLFSLRNLKPSEVKETKEDGPRFWRPPFFKEHFDPLKRAVLVSSNLEADVSLFLKNSVADLEGFDVNICTTLSEVAIPAHGFIMGARTPLLRDALKDYRKSGINNNNDIFTISGEGKLTILFSGFDFLTILNLALYAYTDKIVDVWHFTRHDPKSAFRYRQVRVELMKVASKLEMARLESAVRLMSEPEPCLNLDLASAFEDEGFFEDGDAVVELDGSKMQVHSALIRQRCPFFEGLFNGRAAGKWILARREAHSDAINIDMKHIDPATFKLVLRHIYADVGVELFDGIVAADIDEFYDIVMDVLSVANELMLDRLSQICQQIIGRFVNTRNICQLVNAIAPCAITEFKDAGLEYLCLQLETMLENYLLNELDDDLMLELDEVVRGNQLACLPFAKCGRAEMQLHERHPGLAEEIYEERQYKIRDMAFRNANKDEDARLSSSQRIRVGSVDDTMSSSPSQEKSRRKPKVSHNAPFSPAVRPKDSTPDLMFDMDDEESAVLGDPALLDQTVKDAKAYEASITTSLTPLDSARHDISRSQPPGFDEISLASPPLSVLASTGTARRMAPEALHAEGASTATAIPWSSAALPSSKLDMKEIMAQASRGRKSTLSMRLSAAKARTDAAEKASIPKMSQKERKKQQHDVLQQVIPQPIAKSQPPSTASPLAPWQVTRTGPTLSLKDLLSAEGDSAPTAKLDKQSVSPITLGHIARRTASPDTRFPGQRRSNIIQRKHNSTGSPASGSLNISSRPSTMSPATLTPQSHSYIKPVGKAEPSILLSMADIIGQQEREQDIIKEAVAKRSLQEIQEEQAFQEWWDQESRRTQEEEAIKARASAATATENSGGGVTRGKGGKKGRGGAAAKGDSQHVKSEGPQTRGRGRGRGRGGVGRGHPLGQGRGQRQDHAASTA